jgi:hypothetical protein
MASKAMRITDCSCDTDTWRAAIRGRQTSGRSTSSPSELFDVLRSSGFEVRPGDLGENIATIGLDLECLPLGAVLVLGASGRSNSPVCARPVSSSILQVRIEELPAGRRGRTTLSGRRHGDCNGRWRSLARGPDQGSPSCSSPSGPSAALSRRILATGHTSPRS